MRVAFIATGASFVAAMVVVQVISGLRPQAVQLTSVVVLLLASAAVAFASAAHGFPRAAAAFSAVAATGYAAEWVGIRTGLPFGGYAYTDILWPQVGGVPVIVALAWGGMGLAAHAVAGMAIGPPRPDPDPPHSGPGRANVDPLPALPGRACVKSQHVDPNLTDGDPYHVGQSRACGDEDRVDPRHVNLGPADGDSHHVDPSLTGGSRHHVNPGLADGNPHHINPSLDDGIPRHPAPSHPHGNPPHVNPGPDDGNTRHVGLGMAGGNTRGLAGGGLRRGGSGWVGAVGVFGGRVGDVGRVVVGAGALVGWDLFLDPQMIRLGLWTWDVPGPYRGVPISNFAGWVAVSLVVMALLGAILNGSAVRSTGLIAVYTVMAVMETVGFAAVFDPPDRLVAATGGICMGVFALLAWRRRWQK
ncbi:carotenoid biosynthesis protein [Sphaerisporangium corydalis]|uniref:Carotenoid biosynthesis protein n=1 Tax=Sphaerisporangium corydalis TaxID=1441875 RepID=A0ABV9E8Z9_9ACTN|nr:carotenoid biosynthesis protein [Sphaerisporangium corydalis]